MTPERFIIVTVACSTYSINAALPLKKNVFSRVIADELLSSIFLWGARARSILVGRKSSEAKNSSFNVWYDFVSIWIWVVQTHRNKMTLEGLMIVTDELDVFHQRSSPFKKCISSRRRCLAASLDILMGSPCIEPPCGEYFWWSKNSSLDTSYMFYKSSCMHVRVMQQLSAVKL